MNGEEQVGTAKGKLIIRLDAKRISVSHLSSLLRVLQAALREVARSNEDTRRVFDEQSPILLLSWAGTDTNMSLQLVFADSSDSTPLAEFSESVFKAFVDTFGQFIRLLPQPSLFGGGRNIPRSEFSSELSQRMHHVHRELRRAPKASVTFEGRSIEIEGDMVAYD